MPSPLLRAVLACGHSKRLSPRALVARRACVAVNDSRKPERSMNETSCNPELQRVAVAHRRL